MFVCVCMRVRACVCVCVCVGQTWHVLADLKLIFLFECLERDFGALWKLQNGKVLISVHLAFNGVKVKFSPLTPNDDYSGRTAPLTSKRCILYIYSTHIGTEYFKHGIYSPIFPLQNAACFINLTYLVPVLFTFYIESVLKLKKKIIPAPKG